MDTQEEYKYQLLAFRAIKKYILFQQEFRAFKDAANLKKLENVHEPVSGIVDKLGRLVRHVKHNDRNDPKPNYPDDAAESFQGILSYLDMIMENFDDLSEEELTDGMLREMLKSVKQHTKKEGE